MTTIKMKLIQRRLAPDNPLYEGRLGFGMAAYLAIVWIRGDPDECHYCHDPLTDDNRTLDHVLPKSQGGMNHVDNLVLACASCNLSKSNRTPEQWRDGIPMAAINKMIADRRVRCKVCGRWLYDGETCAERHKRKLSNGGFYFNDHWREPH